LEVPRAGWRHLRAVGVGVAHPHRARRARLAGGSLHQGDSSRVAGRHPEGYPQGRAASSDAAGRSLENEGSTDFLVHVYSHESEIRLLIGSTILDPALWGTALQAAEKCDSRCHSEHSEESLCAECPEKERFLVDS